MSADFRAEKMYSYLKGYFAAMRWDDALSALSFAREQHAPQTRKGGQPYVVHPLTMACHAVALDIRDEDVAVACLLHDVVEDCDVSISELPIASDRARDAVRCLTHLSGDPLPTYYRGIRDSDVACIVKLLDRCDNVSTMAGVFSADKTQSYIGETREFVMPLRRHTKDRFPKYSNQLFVLKYHIVSVIDGLEQCLDSNSSTNKEREVK